jgi:hypothetical protein
MRLGSSRQQLLVSSRSVVGGGCMMYVCAFWMVGELGRRVIV